MKNPFVLAGAALMVIVPPFAMHIIEQNKVRAAIMAIAPEDLPGQVVMYTSPG